MSSTLLLCLASAILLSAPYLTPGLLPFSWIAFLPLFFLVFQSVSLRQAAFRGWLTGFFTHLLGFYWLVDTITVFGGLPAPMSGVVFLVYAALQGLQLSLFALLVKRCGLGPFCLFPPLFWVVMEFWFPLLFPWYLANSQLLFIPFIQTADLVGPYGASFVVMGFNAGCYDALSSWKNGQAVRWRSAIAAAVLIAASVAYGLFRLQRVDAQIAAAKKLQIAAVQGNIDVDLKWNPALARQNLQAYQKLTAQAGDARLVIWPETAVESWVPEKLAQLPADLVPPIDPEKTYFAFGARSFRGRPAAPDFKAFNSVFLTVGTGSILGYYHKQVLLAFGEYLPFAKLLSKLPAMPFAEGFTPGEGPRTLDMPGGVRIAPLICYEDLMPDLSRRFVSTSDANVLINFTNDAWYGRTVAPWQHARLAQWRAIETRRSLVRVTNTGVTSVINAKGEMVRSLPIFTPAVLKAEVELLDGETPYVRFGDWFAWTSSLLAAAVVLATWRNKAIEPGL
jgi:apolipoprotein N-acyltransferase